LILSKVLGIDQSLSSTGWCLVEGEEVLEYGLITSDKNKNKFHRMVDVAIELILLVDKYQPDVISVEGLPFGNMPGNVGKDLAGLQAAIVIEMQRSGYLLDTNIYLPPPTAVKKLATGSGKAKKDDMVTALPDMVRVKFEKVPKSRGRYDLADAYWLAIFGDNK
jgi:crossover junction endodeoxyribonuclease RuvC